jgi:steroid delta-isomerase-like uncharacterized protein
MTATQEANKALIRRTYGEAFNRGDLTNVEAFVHPNCVDHEEHGVDRGPESLRGLVGMLRTAFPDLHFTIEELIAEGEMVAGRFTMRGTHQGPLMGLAPTGCTVKQSHMHFFRFQDGKVIEHWGVRDDVGMMQQLGVVPER